MSKPALSGSEFRESLRRTVSDTAHDDKMLIFALRDENDALRSRNAELVEALKLVVEWVVLNKPRTYPSGDWGAYPPDCIEQARAALSKAPA